MNRTSNYNLYVTDDNSERFIDWRTQMNGTSDSNMVKIDTALAEKANHSKSIFTLLVATEWISENDGNPPFMQTIEIEGLTENQNGTISIAPNATPEQQNYARESVLYVAGQADNMLVIAAASNSPMYDIPVCITLID